MEDVKAIKRETYDPGKLEDNSIFLSSIATGLAMAWPLSKKKTWPYYI